MKTNMKVKQIVNGLETAKTQKAFKESMNEFWKYTSSMYPKYARVLNKIGAERIKDLGIDEDMDELLLNILGVIAIVTKLEEAIEV